MTGCVRPATLALMLLARGAWAGPSMTSGANTISRDVDNEGGAVSFSGTNQMTLSVGETVVLTTMSSSANVIRSGWSELASSPGAPVALSSASGGSASSVALNWDTPPYDGNQGTLQSGSAYLIQVASSGYTGIFSNVNNVTVAVSTSGAAIGAAVGAVAGGLDAANTTYYAQVWTRDADANVSGPSAQAVVTTLANPPSPGALEFLWVKGGSVTVSWAAMSATVPSQSAEGYTLLASSDNFGAIAPGGAPVFSSTTYSVLDSTLTLGTDANPLALANTYYFQVASLNWTGQPNYTTLPRLNLQIQQSATLLNLPVDPSVSRSAISASSVVVTNVGNWPVTIALTASTATLPSSPWTLSTAPDIETAVLWGVWNSAPPGPSAFNTFLTPATEVSQVLGGNYAGDETGYQIPPGQSRTLWFRFTIPTTTVTPGPEVIQLLSQGQYP